jgi:hypothetical protein
MRLISISAAILLCLASSLPAQEGEKVTLEWKFKKGETLRYEMSQVQNIEFSGNEMVHEMVFGMAMEITDVTTDGTGSLKMTYDRIKVKMTGPMMASDYDSEKDKRAPEGDMMGRVFAAFLGKSVTAQLSRKGECLKFEGMGKLMDAALKELPEEMQGMAEMFKASMNDDYAKSMMQMSVGFLPKAPVAKGETWSDSASLSLGMMGKMDMKTKSTLKELRNGGKEAVVGQDTKFEFKAGEGGPMGPMEVTDSKMKSEMVWLIDRGVMQSTKGTMSMDMNAGGQEMTISSKIEMKLAPKSKDVPSVDPKNPKDPKEGK